MRSPVVFVGDRFERLVVLAEVGRRSGKRLYRCACDCGQTTSATSKALRSGSKRSCGCLRREGVAALGRSRATHGHARDGVLTPTYQSWAAMHKRCSDPNGKDWHLYGGRGVTVCTAWSDFAAFLADMGERPDGLTLDRVNPYGNYEPGNCRWATRLE
jgi:hypothetical protein